jgi:hypothetical protein
MPKLFKTDISSEADLKVFVTDIRTEADLIVYRKPDLVLHRHPKRGGQDGVLHRRPVGRRPDHLQDRRPVGRRLGEQRQVGFALIARHGQMR